MNPIAAAAIALVCITPVYLMMAAMLLRATYIVSYRWPFMASVAPGLVTLLAIAFGVFVFAKLSNTPGSWRAVGISAMTAIPLLSVTQYAAQGILIPLLLGPYSVEATIGMSLIVLAVAWSPLYLTAIPSIAAYGLAAGRRSES